MNPAKLLYELQLIDLDIDNHTASLEQVEAQLGESEELRLIREELALERERLSALAREQRRLEWEADDLGARIKGLEERLYGGGVHNPKELGSLQEEVAHLKARCSHTEDRALEIILEIEEGEATLKAREEELRRAEVEWDEAQEGLRRERERLLSELEEMKGRREKAVAQIDAEGLRLYQDLRAVKGGKATVRVEQGRCQGCRLSLPMQTLRLAQSGRSLVQCSSCGRILYASS